MTDPKPSQKGQLFWRDSQTGGSWYGRYYATVEGERIRVARSLGTTNKAVARSKLQRLIGESETAPQEARRGETFEEAARRIVDARGKAGMATWKDRLARLEKYAFPEIGQLLPSELKASHVRTVLEMARDDGKARETMGHIKNDVSSVLAELWQAEELPENVCGRVKVPEALAAQTARSKKERAS